MRIDDMIVKAPRIENDYATALCEEEGLVLGEANLTYQMEGSRLASEQVKYEFYDKNQAPAGLPTPMEHTAEKGSPASFASLSASAAISAAISRQGRDARGTWRRHTPAYPHPDTDG